MIFQISSCDLRISFCSLAFQGFLTYCRIYKNGQTVPADNSLDYAANFSHMLGLGDPKMLELMRLYVTIHRLLPSFPFFNILLIYATVSYHL